jgi:hypothetical protein
LNVAAGLVIEVNDLFGFHKIGHMAVIVHPTDIEASSSSLAAQSGDETCFALSLCGIHRSDLYATAHGFEQPLGAVDIESLQMKMQSSIPGERKAIIVKSKRLITHQKKRLSVPLDCMHLCAHKLRSKLSPLCDHEK